MKLLLIPFIIVGLVIGNSIRLLFSANSFNDVLNIAVAISMSSVIAGVIYYLIIRSVRNAHAKGVLRVAGWTKSAWVIAPILTIIIGIPLGIFLVQIGHFLSPNHG